MSRYYKALVKKLKAQILDLNDRDEWKARALSAEERCDKYDMNSSYNQDRNARVGMEAMARLKVVGTSYCAQCDRDTIKVAGNICIACGVKTA